MRTAIAFFDIDGTLIHFGENGIHEAVLSTLLQMQSKGIRLFLATGRPPFFLPEFQGIRFDGALCFNGGYGYSREEVIYSNPISAKDVQSVTANAEKLGLPVALSTVSRHGCNGFEKNLEDYLAISGNTCQIVEDFGAFRQEEIYQIMVGSYKEQDEALLAGTEAVKTARWWDRAVDVIPANSGKAHGIEMILRHYGLRREECIAFGDGGNDMDMIRYAGIGIAMGNAGEEVKAAADYVTDTCAEDGVASAIRHLHILDR